MAGLHSLLVVNMVIVLDVVAIVGLLCSNVLMAK